MLVYWRVIIISHVYEIWSHSKLELSHLRFVSTFCGGYQHRTDELLSEVVAMSIPEVSSPQPSVRIRVDRLVSSDRDTFRLAYTMATWQTYVTELFHMKHLEQGEFRIELSQTWNRNLGFNLVLRRRRYTEASCCLDHCADPTVMPGYLWNTNGPRPSSAQWRRSRHWGVW